MNRVNIDYRCGELSWNALAYKEEPMASLSSAFAITKGSLYAIPH
jgi:hypothetical protein